MLQRVGISMDDSELKHLKILQKRFGARSRSELFRELVKRYEKLEDDFNSLNRCLNGYLKHPESSEKESAIILKTAVKNQPPEDWA